MLKPRVFISSVMEQFGDRREAARRAVESVDATPVMAEDFPAVLDSPRNACLDGVDSADVCVVIVGARGGWIAPSGKLVVEEEYEEAIKRNLLVAVYIEETTRDADAERLVRRLSDYISGHFRATFQTPEQLREVMTRHLPAVLEPLRLPMTSPEELADRLSKPYEVQYQTTTRLVVAPERDEEVIDRVMIGSPAFLDTVLAIGHSAGTKVFDYRASKENELKGDVLVIQESSNARRRHGEPSARVEITPEAMVIVDRVVSPAETDDPLDVTGTFFLVRRDIELALTTMFTFVGRLFDSIDRFQRHQRVTYGVSFAGIGFRSLVDHVEKRSSYSMASDVEGAVVIERPRVITRNVLNQPSDEVARVIALLERRINKNSM